MLTFTLCYLRYDDLNLGGRAYFGGHNESAYLSIGNSTLDTLHYQFSSETQYSNILQILFIFKFVKYSFKVFIYICTCKASNEFSKKNLNSLNQYANMS